MTKDEILNGLYGLRALLSYVNDRAVKVNGKNIERHMMNYEVGVEILTRWEEIGFCKTVFTDKLPEKAKEIFEGYRKFINFNSSDNTTSCMESAYQALSKLLYVENLNNCESELNSIRKSFYCVNLLSNSLIEFINDRYKDVYSKLTLKNQNIKSVSEIIVETALSRAHEKDSIRKKIKELIKKYEKEIYEKRLSSKGEYYGKLIIDELVPFLDKTMKACALILSKYKKIEMVDHKNLRNDADAIMTELLKKSTAINNVRYKSANVALNKEKNEICTLYNQMTTNFASFLSKHDWKHIDRLIYYIETGRADTIKETLTILDQNLRIEQLSSIIVDSTNFITKSVSENFNRLNNTIKIQTDLVNSNLIGIQAGIITLAESIGSVMDYQNSLIANIKIPSNELSDSVDKNLKSIADDVEKIRRDKGIFY